MQSTITESPLMRVTLLNGAATQPMMNTGRERTAIRAMEMLRAMGANPLPTHRLPNGMGYVAPDTGRVHGPLTAWMTRRGTSRCDSIHTPHYAVRPQDVPSTVPLTGGSRPA